MDAKTPQPRSLPRRPPEQIAAGQAHFAAIGLDVGHFPALWHSYQLGQLLSADLNRISGQHGLSISDFHLLGALMIDAPQPLRASDLALTLHVSNAALSGRIARLVRQGLVRRTADQADRRAAMLHLTEAGGDKVRAIGLALQAESRFVRHYRQLDEGRQAALAELMQDLHVRMDRDFVPVPR